MAWGKSKDEGENEKKEEGLSTIGEAQIQSAVDHVISMMDCDVDDFDIRNKISTSMKRAVRMSTSKGGDINEPNKTAIHRFATLLDGCKSFEELEDKCFKAFNGRADFSARKLLYKFDFDWSMNYKVPTLQVKPLRKGSQEAILAERVAAQIEEKTPIEVKLEPELFKDQEVQAEITLATACMKIEALERKLIGLTGTPVNSSNEGIEALKLKFKNHAHLDGKVVIIEV